MKKPLDTLLFRIVVGLIAVAWIFVIILLLNQKADAQEYHYFPKRMVERLVVEQQNGEFKAAMVIVKFVPKPLWESIVKQYWKKADPWEVAAFTVQNNPEGKPRLYQIFVRLTANGEADTESLGHEMAHVFELGWHAPVLEEEYPNKVKPPERNGSDDLRKQFFK